MTKPRPRWLRALRWLGWVVLALVLAVYVGLPVAMAVVAVWPAGAEVGTPPAGFEEVTLTTGDGVDLAAWYAPPRNGAAVIVAHGAGGSREDMRGTARMLAEHGYGVLALDLRGHGASGGRTNRFGWPGTADVRAAAEFLDRQGDVQRIGALGSSMGGEVLLGASGACSTPGAERAAGPDGGCPAIRAIVADGATRRSTAELLSVPSERPLVRSFTARVMFAAVRLLTWQPPPPPLLDEMQRAGATSFLFIAAGENEQEVAFNEVFARTLGERATLWVVPGVAHTGAYAHDPAEYERRVLTFLDEHLLPAK